MEYLCNYFPLTLLASVCAKGIFIRFFSMGNDIEKKNWQCCSILFVY